jgi:Flp pilus assembly protein TadD
VTSSARARRLPLLAWILAALAGAGTSAAVATAEGTARPRPIVLVGIDGGDWLAIDPLVAAGRLPTFARLKARGRTGLLVATPPILSPIVWTTIATGRRPEDHRILDFMVDLPGGGQAPVTSSERRVAALWNVFSDHGRTVGVVGWLATWPAESVRGTVVSDRVGSRLANPLAAPDPQAFFPPSSAAELAALLVRPRDLTREDLAQYVPLTAAEHEAARRALAGSPALLYRDPLAHLAEIVAGTRSYARLAEALVAPRQPDLLMVYLEGVDALSHRFIRDSTRGPRAIERAYRDADSLVGRLAALVEPSTWILVCSDHGFFPPDAGVSVDPAELAGPASAWHRPYGIVAAIEAGTLAAASATPAPRDAGTVTPLDLAPTILHAAGLPVSLEMPGRVVESLLPPEAVARPVTKVRSLEPERRMAAGAAGRPIDTPDPAVRERLMALGYVGAGTTSLARLNLGEILYRRGDYSGAERELRAVVSEQPGNVSALLWLAKAIRAQDRPQAALALYERALALDGAGDVLVEAVELAATMGSPEAARRILTGFHPTPQTRADTALARAILAGAEGRPQEAERELRAALALDPARMDALQRLVDVLQAGGRASEAIAPLGRAAARAPASAEVQALLGSALLVNGDLAGAEEHLARALRLAPDAASVRLELARVRLAQGRDEDARALLSQSPPSRERSVLLGVAASHAGAWEEAARHYREALEGGLPDKNILNGLAWALYRSGRSREAAELLDRSLALDGAQPEIRRLRAELAGPEGR